MRGLVPALGLVLLLVITLFLRREPRVSAVQTGPSEVAPAGSSRLSFPPVRGATLASRSEASGTDLLYDADATGDPEQRSELLNRTADAISNEALPEHLQGLVRNPSPAASELRQLLLRRWTEIEPMAAAKWAASLTEGASSAEALAQVAVTWVNNDPGSAIAWAKSLTEGAGKSCALLNMAYETARNEPLASMELAVLLPPSLDRDRLLEHVISQWSATDSNAAMNWADSLRDPELRQRLMADVLVALARSDGAVAANLAVSALRPGGSQDRAVVAIVQRWAETSPRAAADWVSRIADTPIRQIAVQNLVTLWAAQDLAGPVNWLQSMPPSIRTVGWAAYGQFVPQEYPNDQGPVSADTMPLQSN